MISKTKNSASSTSHLASSIPISNNQNPKSKTGFIFHEIYLKHKTGSSHPERPQRLELIVARIKKMLDDSSNSWLKFITPEITDDYISWITHVHDKKYVERVRKSCREGIEYMDSADTPISSESYNVAIAAVGGVLTAIDKVMKGEIKNAFCAIRPPGHHALRDRAMGFCLFNNAAIGARYIQKKHSLSKVLIVDWDVHHGNGTQDFFYDDPSVLYFSIHQSPFYPGTGSKEEKGIGKGYGYTINIPLPAGSGDEDYKKAFLEILKPKALEFKPDFILISAGFDAYKDDPLGGMNITVKGYSEMTRIIRDIADKCCHGRIVSILEGGYDLNGLADSVESHIFALEI
ncbi:histone deacetylase [Candidatus Poribacteria bacterium]|nr:histone deacetylase [Candidatus Poribacteria bacterium]